VKRADSLLAPIIRNLGIEDSIRLGRIKKEWAGVFEKTISFHTCPASLKEEELLVNVDSPVWLQQLSFYKEDIVKKLRGFGVKAVRFRLGRVFPEKKKEQEVLKKRLLTSGDNAYIEETVSSIPAGELRDKIKKAIEKSFVYGKRS